MGVGTVHHIAWRANDDPDHLEWQKHAQENGQLVTEEKTAIISMRFTSVKQVKFYLKSQQIHQDSHMMNQKKQWAKN